MKRLQLKTVAGLIVLALLTTESSAQFRFKPGYRPPVQASPNSYPYRQPRPKSATSQPKTGGGTPVNVLRYAIKKPENPKRYPRLSGEFEPQKAVLLSVSDLMYQHNGVLVEIIQKSANRGVPFVILFNDNKQLVKTVKLLDSIGCDLGHVSLFRLKLDTIWLRDFGPRFSETETKPLSLDFYYNGQRPLDDQFPTSWGQLAGAEIGRIQWTIQGGNLHSNGDGFAITTSRLFEDNAINFNNFTQQMDVEFEKRKIVIDAFKQECNIDQLLILEPLRPEATKHVDMFSTFVAKDKIVVAKLDPRVDPPNARTLEYNVNLLKQIQVDGKPLQVERIEFPPRNGKYWSPYTNVILANNLLLMPIYKSDPPAMVRKALDVYRRLLPDCHVDTVDMTSMQKLEGALHCMSINVPEFASLPRGILTMEEARTQARKFGYNPQRPMISKSTLPQSSNSRQPNSSKGALSDRVKEQGNQTAGSTGRVVSQTPRDPAGLLRPKRGATGSGDTNAGESDREKQMAAALTYRRRFLDATRRFKVDAYAVGFQQGSVVLLESGKSREVLIAFEKLCDADQQWLTLNAQKIRANGKKVKQFVVANQL